MGKKATKAADNMYYMTRYEASKENEIFSSREKASEQLGIDRTRLANIELGNVLPYPEEVKCFAETYNCPEICNFYCSTECPIGKNTVAKIELDDFDRLALKVLGSLRDIDELRDSIIAVSEDGRVTDCERERFKQILQNLEKISTTANALQIWAKKNVFNEE